MGNALKFLVLVFEVGAFIATCYSLSISWEGQLPNGLALILLESLEFTKYWSLMLGTSWFCAC